MKTDEKSTIDSLTGLIEALDHELLIQRVREMPRGEVDRQLAEAGIETGRSRSQVLDQLEALEEESMRPTSTQLSKPTPILRSYAELQLEVNTDSKKALAEWIVLNPRLESGWGVFLDAGSQCFFVWAEILKQLLDRQFSQAVVMTSSFLVLESWVKNQNQPQLAGSVLELAGDQFDGPHCAFYGAAAEKKLRHSNFRPSVVYIGTSGILFEEDDLMIGYHAGDLERDAKQLLFQCPAERRVILVTPSKFGKPGGRVMRLLDIEELDSKAEIYLVTPAAAPGSKEELALREAEDNLLSSAFQQKLEEKEIEFHLVIVSFVNGTPEVNDIVGWVRPTTATPKQNQLSEIA